MDPEEQIIRVLEEATHTRELKFLVLDLVMRNMMKLDVTGLARWAQELPAPNRLGILADIGAIASMRRGMQVSDKLYKLAEALYRDDYKWVHLNPHSPDYAQRILSTGEQSDLNKKWKVYNTLTPEDIEDWISLYWDDGEYRGQEYEANR